MNFIVLKWFRRRNVKRQEQKDQLLLPEQSEKITNTKLSISNPVRISINIIEIEHIHSFF